MATQKKQERQEKTVTVIEVTKEVTSCYVLGSSPLVCNAMSEKVRQELLYPAPPKKKADKQNRLKHEPFEEYRNSPYRAREDDAPTRILLPAASFKRATASAVLDIPGTDTTKAQLGRLCWVAGPYVSVWGIPQMWTTTVRCADRARTPDMRTRAILPEWAAVIQLEYVVPQLNGQAVQNLLAAAGVFVGVGDGRPEKGALDFGRFEIVNKDDARLQRIMKIGGREAQDAALAEPTFYDVETESLITWWQAEHHRRQGKQQAA